MGAPSDLRGMIRRKYDLKEQQNQVALDSAAMQADAQRYAADQDLQAQLQASLLDNTTKLTLGMKPQGFAEGTSNVRQPTMVIDNRIPAPPPPKPVQGPPTLAQTAAGTPAEPFVPVVEGRDSFQGFVRGLNDTAKWLGFACGTSRVPAVHAQGGLAEVPGQGPSNVDSVPAMLAPQEAVLNAPAADMVGRGLIEALNQIGKLKMGMS